MIGNKEDVRRYTEKEWREKGTTLFGEDKKKWKFQCPACGNVRTAEDFRPFKDQGADASSVISNCLGRFTGGKNGPDKCDWAAYGLFAGPSFVKIEDGKEIPVFNFAEK